MSKETWKDLTINISAIFDLCEDAHLNSYGESFYSQHIMFENIQDAIKDFADSIQEIYFGARELGFVSSAEIRKAEIEKLRPIKNGKEGVRVLKDIIIETLDIVKKLNDDQDTTVGEADLLSQIGGTLQHKLYFLQNFLK